MRSKVLIGVLVLSLVILLLVSLNVTKKQTLQQKATESVISSKKGVGGPATLTTLSQVKASWFHNWYYQPTFKDLTQNWDPVIWQKFVPLFYGKQSGTADIKISDICNRTSLGYCAKGNYYLIGNEPDVNSQDKTAGTTNAPRDAAIRQGQIIKAVRTKDPTAKFIILGLSNGVDAVFIQNFIIEWKNYWQINDPTITDLSTIVKGWHFHIYDNYDVCPISDDLPRRFTNTVNQQMLSSFGKIVPNQEIWITEMGSLTAPDPNDTSATGRQNRQKFLNRMTCLTNVYENSPIVTRYAWFYHGCDPASTTWTGCPTVKCTSYNLFYVKNCSSAGGPLEISDLGTRFSILPAVVSPTSTPPSHPTTSLTPTPITTSIPHLTGTGTPTPRPTSTLTLTTTVTRAATHSPTPTPTTTLPVTCQAATTISLKFCYGQCASCENACGAHACIRVFHPAGAPADPDCANYGGTTTEYTAYKCTDTLPKSICSCVNLPTGNPTPGTTITPVASVTPRGATPTPILAVSPTPTPSVSITPIATATLPAETCPLKSKGDADCNNLIDINDFFAWRREFLSGNNNQADFNKNGTVDIIDFNAWRNGFLGR